MPQHDVIAPLGHDRQRFTGLVRPHAQAKEAQVEPFAHGLDLIQVAAGFGACLVQVFQRCARQFKLACRFKADRSIRALHGDDGAVFLNRFPTELVQCQQEIAYTASFTIRRGMMIVPVEHQLFMLSADSPLFARLFALRHRFGKLADALDQRIVMV